MTQEWIPVTERLPEISLPWDEVKLTKGKQNKVQIYSPTTIGVDTGHYWGTEIDGPMKGWSIMGVTHWLPLPEPPVEPIVVSSGLICSPSDNLDRVNVNE
jgi:hypothetical protein